MPCRLKDKGFITQLVSIMKSFIRFLFVIALAFGHTANAGPGRVIVEKLPVLKVPKSVTFDKGPGYQTQVDPVVIHPDGTVSYWAYARKEGLWVNFIANNNGELLGFRVGTGDTFLFSCGTGTGENRQSIVKTDEGEWRKLFWTQVRFRPFILEK